MPENTLKINWPFKPYVVTQHWGNPNPAYAAQFNDPNFKLHNGVDANTGGIDWQGKAVTEYPVYCPVEDFTVLKVDFAPQGGGNELWLVSNKPLQMFERECYAYLPLCHAKKILVQAGAKPALGELLMIADNTGFSTGTHTHMGLYRVGYDGIRITNYYDVNDANGSFSPELFFTGQYAIDLATFGTLTKNNLRYYQYKMGLL